MSRVPMSNNSVAGGSPPVKNRKALSNISEVVNSPKYSTHSTLKDPITKRPTLKMEARKSLLPKASIPTSTRNINSETYSKFQSISQAGRELDLRKKSAITSRQNSNIFDSAPLRDPAALKKQEEITERFDKFCSVQKEKFEVLSSQINEAKERFEELTRSKNSLIRNSVSMKSKINDSEISIINIEHKINNMEKNIEKHMAYEEQMFTVKIKEQQNLLMRELDECEQTLKQGLQDAEGFKDDKIKAEIAELEEEYNCLSATFNTLDEGTREKLKKEREVLEKKLSGIVADEEAKGELITKRYSEKSTELLAFQSDIDSLNSKVISIKNEKQQITKKIEEEEKSQLSYDSIFSELQEKIEEFLLKNSKVDDELHDVTTFSKETTASYEESYNKIEKELKLRRRIQNSIQELNNKLRVYTRVLPTDSEGSSDFRISPPDGNEQQSLVFQSTNYSFDKIFAAHHSENEICDEIVCLNEANLNGANVSVIIAGHEETDLIHVLLKSTVDSLIQREEKYKPKNWKFQYSAQYLSITTDGVIDLLTGSKTTIKLENRTILTDAKSSSISSDIKLSEGSPDASTLIKLSINASNDQKAFTSHSYLMNLSQIKSSDLIVHAVSKIRENKLSNTEFSESPMYQLIHFLYSNTKSLTLMNLSNDASQAEENKSLLELATFVNETDSIPAKRVYNSFE